jgi:hypothetical protein
MEQHICHKRRKRTHLDKKIFEHSESNRDDNNDSDNDVFINIDNIDKKNKYENDLTEILNNVNKLNIDPNKDLFTKIIKKIDDLEKKIETLYMVNIKIDTLKKDIDKILTEKDYIIENLKDEINDLKDQLKESKYNIDNIVSQKTIDNYYT